MSIDFSKYKSLINNNFSAIFAFLIIYTIIIFLFHEIFNNILEVSHADQFYYYYEASLLSSNTDIFKLLKSFLIISTEKELMNLSLPIISFYAIIFKISDSIISILLINSLITLLILLKVNQLITLSNLKKISHIEFFVLSIFLSYLNIGINKEVITIALLLCIIYEISNFIIRFKNKLDLLTILRTFLYLYLFMLVKPLHAALLIPPIIILFIFYFVAFSEKKLFFFAILILFSMGAILLQLINGYYSANNSLFYFFNMTEFINTNRNTFFDIGQTNETLSYLNNKKVELDNSLFTIKNLIIVFQSILDSILFPNFNDIYFAFNQPSRFIIFILFDSIIIKIGILVSIYLIFKSEVKTFFVLNMFILLYLSLIISVNIPNDGIAYRYLYPYKFLMIFIGFSFFKTIVKRK